jgi:hypothetical protein
MHPFPYQCNDPHSTPPVPPPPFPFPFQNREWPYDPTPSPTTTTTTKKPPRQKGHKVDKTKPERLAKIEANLKDMDEKIAKHREARRTRLDKLPYIDRMLLSPKQQREKLKAMNSV